MEQRSDKHALLAHAVAYFLHEEGRKAERARQSDSLKLEPNASQDREVILDCQENDYPQ